MSECPHATKDGFHWCALGPRGRPTVACSMWRAGGSQNWQHGWGDCPRVLRRVVGLLVGVDRTVVRTVKELLLLLGANKRAMDDRPDEAVLLLSPDLCQRLTDALVSWEAALAAAAALAAIEEAK